VVIRVRDNDEERLFTLEEFESRARRGEVSPHAWVCMPALTGDRFVQARELPLFVSLYDPRRVHFRRHFSIARLPLLTGALLLVCVGLFLISRDLGGGTITREVLLLLGAKARARIVEDGELWRLLSANLLHKGAVHLAFNMFALVTVGTALEAIYRRGDYVLLLVISGLSTMGLSVVMSGPVTVGASGLVFGCLGCAVVFGWRFSDVLPSRYRLSFGAVLIIYSAIMFYVGLRNPSTDNWGHTGGLIAGALMGIVLQPRLLRLTSVREAPLVIATPWALSAGLIALCILLAPVVPALLFRTAPYRVDAFGVVLERPSHWSKMADAMGFLTFGNGVDAFASLGCARVQGRSRVDDAVRRYVEGELWALRHSGSITSLDVQPAIATAIGHGARELQARSVSFSFVAADGPFEAEALVFSRGELECALNLVRRPSAPDGSLQRLQDIRMSLDFVDTRAETQALAQTRLSPDDARAWLELALARTTAGQVALAREALQAAATRTTEGSKLAGQVHFARAQLELEHAGDLDAASAALARAEQAAGADDLGLALVRIDIAARSGELSRAKALLDEARERYGEVPTLIERGQALDEVMRDL
jgi:rhomboid protease GluP